jgi:hypothetical protein
MMDKHPAIVKKIYIHFQSSTIFKGKFLGFPRFGPPLHTRALHSGRDSIGGGVFARTYAEISLVIFKP